jgi:hypothetical protein
MGLKADSPGSQRPVEPRGFNTLGFVIKTGYFLTGGPVPYDNGKASMIDHDGIFRPY